MQQAIALIEVNSIAAGMESLDAMVKAARVKVLLAKPVCPGKYIIVVGGEVSCVESARDAGLAVAGETLIDRLYLPRPHVQVFERMSGLVRRPLPAAFGVIETFTVASALRAADASVKAAPVALVQIKLAVGIGGKYYLSMVGEVGDVEASVDAGVETIEPRTLLLRRVILANPHPDAEPYLIWGGDVPRESDRNGGLHAEVSGT